jgi:hypothetical protein
MAFTNDIKKDYIVMRDSLKISFPEAYTFLIMIENHSNRGFHVGTHKNLHLYFNDNFLFYFKKISFGVVEFSSRPNGIIKAQTFNHADKFFTPWMERLCELDLESHEDIEIKIWKKNKVDHCKITITHSSDSQRIFDTITETLEIISR